MFTIDLCYKKKTDERKQCHIQRQEKQCELIKFLFNTQYWLQILWYFQSIPQRVLMIPINHYHNVQIHKICSILLAKSEPLSYTNIYQEEVDNN